MRHSPFFRRMGCLFGFLSLSGLVAFIVLVGVLANALGLFHPSAGSFAWGAPFAVLLVLVVVGMTVRSVLSLRRMSVPLDDLLAASGRLAEGDYSARVAEKGPAEVRALARAFNSMAEKLEGVNRRRRDLLADVTHELRTPLTVIQGNVEGMLDGVYPADEARLKSILEETGLLSRLVEDLRTLALAESGALQLKKEPTDLAVLVRETASAFVSQADTAGVKLELALEETPVLELDPQRIGEVLTNLIANALRYTPRGGRIGIHLAATGSGGERGALVSVTDSGPGIPPADLPNVFDRFYKSRDSGGMGLGLSIAKSLVEAHGGTIRAESEPGRGTTISFSLPFAGPASAT
jgi:two-component system OmpR family sensor kinase/two-component system sensor histidine kinase BaeS